MSDGGHALRGAFPGSTSFYKYGHPDFTLAEFCDGYIYLEPFSDIEGVTPIPGFVNDANLSRAQAQSPTPAFRNASEERFNRAIAWDPVEVYELF